MGQTSGRGSIAVGYEMTVPGSPLGPAAPEVVLQCILHFAVKNVLQFKFFGEPRIVRKIDYVNKYTKLTLMRLG